MIREGCLNVRLDLADGRVESVSTVLDSPGRVAQVLVGRSVAEVRAAVPRLFSVCSVAQGVACARALEGALGKSPSPKLDASREVACLTEACASHVWQLGLAWADAAGGSPDLVRVARARRAVADLVDALFAGSPATASLRAEPRWALAERALEAITGVVADLAGSQSPLEALVVAAGRATFAGLLARLHARRGSALADADSARIWLGRAASASQQALAPVTPTGLGVGVAPTARGLLRHEARARDQRVEGLVIESPTDRTFRPGGALDEALTGAIAGPDLARDAGWVVLALDPCVPWSIEVCHA